jgi:peptidoglycan hydrolase-like protein with peptidoglycan-binding domain
MNSIFFFAHHPLRGVLMIKVVTFFYVGVMSLFLMGAELSAQSLREVATAAARVDRSDTEAVREVQIGLRDLGFYEGPIDGIFGRMTYEAAVAAVEAVNAEVAMIEAARVSGTSLSPSEGGDGTNSDPDVSVFSDISPLPGPSAPALSSSSGSSAISEASGAAAGGTPSAVGEATVEAVSNEAISASEAFAID